MTHSRWPYFAFFFAFLLLVPTIMRAQLSNAVLRGTVTDTSGAAIPGASITLRDVATGVVVRTAAADAHGNFEFPDLTNGVYSLRVERQSFETRVIDNIVLDAGQARRADAVLPWERSASRSL